MAQSRLQRVPVLVCMMIQQSQYVCIYIFLTDINFLLAESVVIKVRIRGIANRY